MEGRLCSLGAVTTKLIMKTLSERTGNHDQVKMTPSTGDGGASAGASGVEGGNVSSGHVNSMSHQACLLTTSVHPWSEISNR